MKLPVNGQRGGTRPNIGREQGERQRKIDRVSIETARDSRDAPGLNRQVRVKGSNVMSGVARADSHNL